MAEVEAGDLVTADTVAELFADLREEDGTPRLSCGVDS
jgi:hypothetical protein